MNYDLIVLGGGAAGLAAARTGARRRRSTLLVQDGPIGGDCTFTGCVPSKSLIEAAAGGANFDAAMRHVRSVVERVAANEDAPVLRAEGIDVVQARARFTGPRTVRVDGQQFSGGAVVIASGAGPVAPTVPGLIDVDFLTNETVFALDGAPASLAVLGGGPVGCELAQAFSRLGVTVTVVEAADRLLEREEPEASAVVLEALRADGVRVELGARVVKAGRTPGGVQLTLTGRPAVNAERLLVATGRRPKLDELGLPAAGVAVTDAGFIRTDRRLATSARGIFAAGDVTGRMPFTHAADAMGRLAAGNALRRIPVSRFDPEPVPWVTFTAPEVARVGMTEAQAADRGGRVAYLPMTEVDRALSAGRERGFVKLLTGPRRGLGNAAGGRVLGATIVAPRGGEMIAEVALAMRTGMFTGRLAQTTHAYPTWSMAVQQAAAQFFMEIGGRRARDATAEPAPTG